MGVLRRKYRQWVPPSEKLEHVIKGKGYTKPKKGKATTVEGKTPSKEGRAPTDRKAQSHEPRRRLILLTTSKRLVILHRSFPCRLSDITDKVWRQFQDVHVVKRFLSADLILTFFYYHDSILAHDPYTDKEAAPTQIYTLERLPKKRAFTLGIC